MQSLSKEDVEKVARLARVELSQNEVQKFQGELARVFTYIEKIQEVDTENIKPTYQPSALEDQNLLDNATRGDTVIPSDDREKLLDAAPERDGDYVKVKSVLK